MKEILSNGLNAIISQAMQEMKEKLGESFQIETVTLLRCNVRPAFHEVVEENSKLIEEAVEETLP